MRTLKSVLANFDHFFQRNLSGGSSNGPHEGVRPLCFTCNSRRLVVLSCDQVWCASVVPVDHGAAAPTALKQNAGFTSPKSGGAPLSLPKGASPF